MRTVIPFPHTLVLLMLPACCFWLSGVHPACAQDQPSQTVAPESHPAGVLVVVTDTTGLVSDDSPMYLASNAVGWNAGDPAMKLSGRSDLRWQILLPPVTGSDAHLEFKLTRGSWETCEVDADLGDISNRTLAKVDPAQLVPGKPYVVELTVEGFADQRDGAPKPKPRTDSTRPLEVSGNAFRVQVVGGAGGAAGAVRDVTVWLPPGYDDPANADRRYPVLYLQDGQHVFERRAPATEEWGADETAAQLIEAGEIEPIIIVGVPNSGANRAAEYLPGGRGTPWADHVPAPLAAAAEAIGVAPAGDAYLDWLVGEVVPRVERVVRASADPADRGIGGASLGGLITLRAAQLHPDAFGRYLVESPSLTLRGLDLTEVMTDGLDADGKRIVIGMGGREYGDNQDRSDLLVRAGRTLTEQLASTVEGSREGTKVFLAVKPDAAHNEAAWNARFAEALRQLYPVQ